MRIGVATFITDKSIDPIRLAVALEERGYESMWMAEHTHIPVSRRSPFPSGGDLPEHYLRSYDPLVALTAAASVTTQLKIATGICLVAQRDPIILAKQIASIDRLSQGRFILGVGFGWNLEEMEAHGVDPRDRWTLVKEHIAVMRRLWVDDEAAFSGELVDLQPSWSWPKPWSHSGPPVILGGAGRPRMIRHVVDYADGWLPNHSGPDTDAALDALREAAETAGRDPATIRVSIPGPVDPSYVQTQRARGIERILLPLPPGSPDDALRFLDKHASLAAAINAEHLS
jgi:probable F420-dependent oxidoreductase